MKGEPVKLLGRGRPTDTPRTRGLKRLLRASYWRAILRGELPAELDPEGSAGTVDRTGGRPTWRVDHDGNRTDDRTMLRDVDEVTAELLGKGHGVRNVQDARKRQPLTDPDEWHALSAALRWLNLKR